MQISGFRVERLIAQGGMASVYLAVQESLGRHVALKVLRKLDDPEQAKRFMDEGRIIAAINHRNVITIHDVGMVGDRPYLAMEYLEGGSLERRIHEGFSVEAALDLVEQIGECLEAVHSRGIVHRDIKPANILFHQDSTPVLSDFGIAKKLELNAGMTLDGTALGSPFYLSPEQAESKAVDGRADIYGLGIIFYEMLMGRRPYEADSYIHTILAHITNPIPTLPRDLRKYQGLLDAMIAKHPDDRFSSAAELVERVRALRRSGLGALARRRVCEYVEGWGQSDEAADAPAGRLPSSSATTQRRTLPGTDADAETLLRTVSRRPAARPPRSWVAAGALALTAALVAGVTALVLRSLPQPPLSTLPAKPGPPSGAAGAAAQPQAQYVAAPVPGPSFPAVPQLPPPESATRAEPGPGPALAALPAPSSPASAPETLAAAESDAGTGPEPGTTTLGQDLAAAETPAPAGVAPESSPPPSPATRIDSLLAKAGEALERYRLTTPAQDSAQHYYREVLKLDPRQPEALSGIVRIADRYATLADAALDRFDYRKANLYLQRGLSVQPDSPRLINLERRLVAIEQSALRRRQQEAAPVEDRSEAQPKARRGFLETLKSLFR